MTVSPSFEDIVAIHEAGHLVAAHKLRVPFSGPNVITIIPSEEYSGRFTHKNIFAFTDGVFRDDDHSRLKMERIVQAALAGIEAQRYLDPASIRCGESYGDWDGGDDYHQAIDLTDRFTSGNEESEAYLELLRIRAQNLVRSPVNWACIDAIATSLVQSKTLSAPQALRIIQQTVTDLVPRRPDQPVVGRSDLADSDC